VPPNDSEVLISTLNELKKTLEGFQESTKAASKDASGESYEKAEAHAKLLAELAEKRLKLTKDIAEAEKDARNSAKRDSSEAEKLKELNKELDELNKKTKLTEDRARTAELAWEKLGNNISANITLSSEFSKSVTGSDIEKGIDSIAGAFKNMGGSLKGISTALTTIGAQFVANMINMAGSLYESENALRKATGASQAFARDLTTVYEANRRYGVSIEENSKAMQSLHKTFTDFTMILPTQRRALTDTAATLSKLGVSNDSFAQGVQNSTKFFGQSADAAAETQLQLVALAQDIGVAPETMAANFAGAGSSMAKFGTDGVDAFKRLAIASKVTGMEVSKILNVVEKFDTFEGAAKQAGMLNAALGGNFVNAMDLMMETDPMARFEMLRDSILDAGLSFDSMSYYQKKFYTEAAGLGDVGELAQMLSGDMDSLAGDMGKNSDELLAMKQNAQSMLTVQQALQAAIAEMTPILLPLIENLKNMALWIGENADKAMLLMKVMLVVAGAIKGATIGAAFGPWGVGIGAFTGAVAALSGLGALGELGATPPTKAIADKISNPPTLDSARMQRSSVNASTRGEANARREAANRTAQGDNVFHMNVGIGEEKLTKVLRVSQGGGVVNAVVGQD